MSGLYTKEGFLNQTYIQTLADYNNISFIVEIGGRQVGKTYGTLDLMLRQHRKFILMRRTISEMEFICNDINNPFTAHRDFMTEIKKDTKYTGGVYLISHDSDPEYIAALMALSAVAKIRGFNGDIYSDLIFDEFIPENHVTRIRAEGEAFLNAIVTISGNRELSGRPPLRSWLLANSNNLNSPILQILNIMEKVEDMRDHDQEISIMKDRGIMIILPKSEQIMNARKKTAIFKAISPESEFARMAFGNEFSYNDDSNIKHVNIREYILKYICGEIAYYKHKDKSEYYVCCHVTGTAKEYPPTLRGRTKCLMDNPMIKKRYFDGKTYFESLSIKERFLDYFINV